MSDSLAERPAREGSWTRYEVGAFETGAGSHARPPTEFTPLQFGGVGETVATGFQEYGKDSEDPPATSLDGGLEKDPVADLEQKAGPNQGSEKDAIADLEQKGDSGEGLGKGSIADLEQMAYEKGFAQGEKDGFEWGEQRGIKVLENIKALLGEMTNLKEDILRQTEEDILETIFTIAEKIIQVHIGLDDGIVRKTILNAVQYAAEKHTITLKINPEDFNYVEKLRPEIFTAHRAAKSVTVTADGSVSRGGCFLETPSGDVDARIETQLEKISECLHNTFSGRP